MSLNEKQKYTEEELRNRSIQLNPNNEAFWKCRGRKKRPKDWKRTAKST
ncbi:hypothetical protein H2O64_21755 [Kordia sp. YSTF-M3]|uniref:Uncharacterized protein n=1 Tax=Kordia aestuariivivens TaxID=2759037 RepID=A0ABR7QFF5_9FLAO|nr:hypothetical protein [Kordia aestuariivivens]MBC8757310.1 hypothetical protein [Kordia aestuariivivens]